MSFTRVLSPDDRKQLVESILTKQQKLKKRFQDDYIEKQNFQTDMERDFSKFLVPTREIAKETSNMRAENKKGIDDVLKILPEQTKEIVDALDKRQEEATTLQSSLPTVPQFFTESGRQRIAQDPIELASRIPADWKLLVKDEHKRLNPEALQKVWPKWVFREYTGKKQARESDPEWKEFEKETLRRRELTGYKRSESFQEATKIGRGIRFYSNPDDLSKRLIMLVNSFEAGNTSTEGKNEALDIVDEFEKKKYYTKNKINVLRGMVNNYMSSN